MGRYVLSGEQLEEVVEPLIDADLKLGPAHTNGQKRVETRRAVAAVLSATLNLVGSTIGAGVVGLPYAFDQLGVVAAAVFMVIVAVTTQISLFVLVEAGLRAKLRSYSSIGKVLHSSAPLFVDSFLVVILLGVVVSSVIIIKDCADDVIAWITSGNSSSSAISATAIATIVVFCVILPLSLPRRLTALKFSSLLSIVALVYVISLVVYAGVDQWSLDPPSTDRLISMSWQGALRGAPVIVYSFGCQVQVLPIFWELPGRMRSQSEFRPAVFLATTACFLLFSSTGIFGVFAFWQDGPLTGDVVQRFSSSSQQAFVARLALGVSLSFMSPLLVWPIRAGIAAVWDAFCPASLVGLLTAPGEMTKSPRMTSQSSSLPRAAEAENDIGINRDPTIPTSVVGLSRPARWAGHMATTVMILGLALLLALAVPTVSSLFRFIGAFGGCAIFYVYPGAVYFAAAKGDAWRTWHGAGAAWLVAFGLVVGLVSGIAACLGV